MIIAVGEKGEKMKIIDADKLHYKTVRIATQKGTKPELVVFAKEIQKMPEIVRCMDCKHNSLGRFFGNTYCDLGIGLYQLDNFCSRGERREDETD